jgi:hypothetical protein
MDHEALRAATQTSSLQIEDYLDAIRASKQASTTTGATSPIRLDLFTMGSSRDRSLATCHP